VATATNIGRAGHAEKQNGRLQIANDHFVVFPALSSGLTIQTFPIS
jgi:hypothetical protein